MRRVRYIGGCAVVAAVMATTGVVTHARDQHNDVHAAMNKVAATATTRCNTASRTMATASRCVSHTCRPVHAAMALTRRAYTTATCVLHARRMRASRRTRSREPAEGDWLCQCGETNRRSKRECLKCGSPAPPLPPGVRRPSLPGEDPHDWACACGQMNFRGSVLCYKCQQPKPDAPPLPGKEVTLWTCAKCKSINRSTRKFCYKCSLPSPLLDFKPLV